MNKSLSLSLFFLILLFSCHHTNDPHVEIQGDETTHLTGQAMTIRYHIIIGQILNNSEISTIKHVIKATFQEIDSIYNKWNPNSELSYINHIKAGVRAPLSPNLEQFLKQTDEIVHLSGGRFDPTVEPLQQLWKTKLKEGKEPADDEIAIIAPAIGWNNIHFGDGMFTKDHDLTALDLGGIAKGYCIDLLIENIYNQGFTDIYVEWGGEISCKGMHPDKRPWTIYISRLGNTDPSQAVALLTLDNESVATSGDYLQNWSVVNAKNSMTTFFHIFDPKTLRPLETSDRSIASASVAAPSCALADGLATAALLFPNVKEAEAWANKIKESFPEISFWMVNRQ